jgi:adenylosuccinate lyase
MIAFELILMDLAEGEKNTIQIGRTHGQHAEPITFGLALAQYVSRWGSRILKVREASENLVGKFSGAVGAYNASSLFFENPDILEADLMRLLGLKQAEISTQIVPPEPLTDFVHSVVSSFGVLANFARDMRNLQRSEIGEVEEPFGEEQTGSSTMPQKRNPINFENVESAWKKFMPQMVTVYLDQVSEHQRDLTNSLSQRYIPELLVIFDSSIRRMCRVMKKLRVKRETMLRNFEINKDKIVAEPLYLFLAHQGHPNAHERVRQLTIESYNREISLLEIALRDKDLQPFIRKFTPNQIDLLKDPAQYLGIAQSKTEKIVKLWRERLKNNSLI